MALIIFVVAFVLYNYVFKKKSVAATTVATAATPTYGRPTIYNQEFKQFPVGNPNVTPVTPAPPVTSSTRLANGKDDTLQGFSNYFGTPVARLMDLNPSLKQYGANGVLPAGTSVIVTSL